jgi:uncharacterized lipoprotein YddW (UPF0748 family)
MTAWALSLVAPRLAVAQQPLQPIVPVPAAPLPEPPPEGFFDPAEQIAPAGVPVELGPLPISAIEAIAMRQELENIIGRVESARLSANALTAYRQGHLSAAPHRLSNPETAPGTPTTQLIADRSQYANIPANTPTDQALRRAEQILEEFPALVERGDYATARARWLEARELLWSNFPTDRPLAQPEIRAMWLDRGTIVAARSRQGLTRIFDRLAAAGINTVFIETVNAGYPIYPSAIAPEQNPLTRGWDPLADAVDLAHERGMELHAWVWVFAAGNTRHNAILRQPNSFPGPLLAAHPDWANYDNRGRMIPPGQTKPFLDPANPAVRSYLLRLFQEIVTNYDVDGLQLDYIRYPFQDPSAGRTYGYGRAARQQFQALTGVDPATISPNNREIWQQWTDFRVNQVDQFVSETSRLMRRLNDDLILSVAVFPLPQHERLQKIQQNWEAWVEAGTVDLVVTMSYAADTNRLQRLIDPYVENEDLGPALVIPSIRLLDLPESAMFDQIQAIRDLPVGGFALFAVANLNSTLQTIFSNTQGTPLYAAHPGPIPYRQPFYAAAARFEALQQEWLFLLATEQLWIDDSDLSALDTHATTLLQTLQRLVEQPTPGNLQQARQELGSFRDRFSTWMGLQGLNDSYRIDAWNQRLESMERLLNYGEWFVIGDRQLPN